MVTPTLVKTSTPQTFDQFLKQCPEEGRFEWVNGEIIEMVNTREHIDIATFLTKMLDREVDRLNLNYVVRQEVYIRTSLTTGKTQGRIPDISVIDRDQWRSDRGTLGALTEPIQLAVEVVSSNWETDYLDKLDEYQRLGIKEYWIVDYLAIGSRDILGEPKQPTVSIYTLNGEGVYDRQAFQGQQTIVSGTFSELVLTPEEIFTT
ncbi:Uma2 family endonuclease [Synechocystis sp. PCC 7339]|uniref:Uma2 family endonuclease n=1 Tax=unclassified Synechocystis TaxID=2640012 RepID=UPI001BB03523|nr:MULTISPECIES: Uma2 family endonuclease [unclassified Synechocystis]QUS59400.1 Uma2 family endonuclease [Synechocystis sp. PCC 7338]UAJ71583.1 Uma2 family endonuclease [Synechocystis sp. PCC 7339]